MAFFLDKNATHKLSESPLSIHWVKFWRSREIYGYLRGTMRNISPCILSLVENLFSYTILW